MAHQNDSRITATQLTKEHEPHSPIEVLAPPRGLNLDQAIAAIEAYKADPKTTLLITDAWELVTYQENEQNPRFIIGRCEIRIQTDKTGRETYFFHRIEADLSRYAIEGDKQAYFLNFMRNWLQIIPDPFIFEFDEPAETSIEPFSNAQVLVSFR